MSYPLSQTPSKLLAKAVIELFPNAELSYEWIDFPYFAYEIHFSAPFHEEMLFLIEEKMRELSKKRLQVRKLEMVPSNASELFLHKEQPLKSALCEESEEPLLNLIECEEFFDLEADEILPYENPFFTLLGYEKAGQASLPNTYRVFGIAAEDKQKLNLLKKKFKDYTENAHFILGEALGLFYKEEELVWLHRGVLLKEKLYQLWKETVIDAGFDLVSSENPSLEQRIRIRNELGIKKIAEISTDVKEVKKDFFPSSFFSIFDKGDKNHFFFEIHEKKEALRSCLQLVVKIPKMLGLEYTAELSFNKRVAKPDKLAFAEALSALGISYEEKEGTGRECTFVLKGYDGLGRGWKIASCSLLARDLKDLKATERILEISLLRSFGDLLYLILEQKKGDLPSVLLPEQVRIVSLEGAEPLLGEVKKALDRAQVAYGIDKNEAPLAIRLKKGWKERIPYVMIIGIKEMQSGEVTLMRRGTQASKKLRIDEIGEFFKNA